MQQPKYFLLASSAKSDHHLPCLSGFGHPNRCLLPLLFRKTYGVNRGRGGWAIGIAGLANKKILQSEYILCTLNWAQINQGNA